MIFAVSGMRFSELAMRSRQRGPLPSRHDSLPQIVRAILSQRLDQERCPFPVLLLGMSIPDIIEIARWTKPPHPLFPIAAILPCQR